MKVIKNFEYLAPQSIEEAVSFLADYKDDAKPIAGGTDLVGMMKDKTVEPKYLVDIRNIKGLDYIEEDEDGGMRIGALTEIAAIMKSKLIGQKYACIHEATESFATPQVRNTATVGGNICRSSPSADMVPPLLVFDSELKLTGPQGDRTVRLEDFFTGPGENVLKDEILVEIRIPSGSNSGGSAFKKLARTSADLAKVNCAVRSLITDGKCIDVAIALGAVAPTPIRARRVEDALKGRDFDDNNLEEAAEKVAEDITPVSDVRSNEEYRTYISKVLIKGLLKEIDGRG